jgi:ammonium transporter, Amt family
MVPPRKTDNLRCGDWGNRGPGDDYPCIGFVSPLSALVIGLLAGSVCYIALNAKTKLGYDDSLDAFGVHGVGGILGTLGAGFLAQKFINPSGADGLFFGNPHQLFVQAISALVAVVYSFIVTLVILKVIDILVGLRISEEEEVLGLDLSQHEESGYTL